MPLSDRRTTDTTKTPRISAAIVAIIALAMLAAAPVPFGSVDAASNGVHADGGVDLGGLEPLPPQLPADAADRVSALRGSADRLRGAADRGGVGGVLGQVMHETGVDVAVPSLPAPTTVVELPQLAALSPALREPVAGLDAAVQQASALLGEVPLAQLDEMLRLEAEALGEWMEETEGFVSPEAGALTGDAAERRDQDMAAHTPWPKSPAGLPPAIARAVANAPQAALLLAAAVDTYVPQLEAAPQATEGLSAGRTVEGCDLVATSDWGQGRLCVASEADNVHRKDYMLVIDLGGNDTYHNSAGGAPYVRTGSDLVAQISLLVDLGGDDRYEPTGDLLGIGTARFLYYATTGYTYTDILQARVASGAGIYGAVGMLVDRDGDDAYVTRVDSRGPGTWTAAYTQGSGRLGVGVLIDDGGNDTYSATGGDGAGVVGVLAQASSHGPCAGGHQVSDTQSSVYRGCDTGLVGLLVDRSGDDHYRIDAGTAEGSRFSEDSSVQLYPVRQASGQASANVGSALLLDQSGSDIFEVRSDGQGPVSTNDERDGVFAFVNAQGSGDTGGTAWLLTGMGDARFETHVTSAGKSLWQWVEAQGAGKSGSAILSDLGGDDRYEIMVERSPNLRVEGDDCCAGHTRLVPAAALSVFGQGRGYLGGSGVLDDGAGNDTYSLASETDLRVQIDGVVEESGAFIDVLRWGNDLGGQGSASWNGAVGALVDSTGTDSYELILREHTDVLAAIEGGEPRLRVLRRAALTGQGATDGVAPISGVLQDLDGAGDRFDARLDFVVHTSPEPAYGFLQPGDLTGAIRVQGSRIGGVFVAAGERPEVTSSPREPVCGDPGARGHGVWRERCGSDNPQAGGVGFAPNAAVPHGVRELEVTASPVTLQDGDLETYEYDQNVPRTLVRAQLTDPDGAPVAGQKLHFALTQDVSTETGRREGPEGYRRFYVSATTNQDGTAWARIPVPLLYSHAADGGEITSTIEELGVLVLFDGMQPDGAAATDGGTLPTQGWTRLEEP